MQFDIEKVEFRGLNETRYDRPGVIAIFYLAKYNNWELVQTRALEFLWRVTSLLSDIYRIRTRGEIMDRDNMTEGNECWISAGSFDEEWYQVRVSHKYWSEKQVACFKEMIISLSKLHGWEMEGVKRTDKYRYRGLPVTKEGWYIGGNGPDGGGGVLEWCTDEEDAKMMLKKMSQYERFSNLKIYRWG